MEKSASASAGNKPKLVFFQWNHQPNLKGSAFLSLHMQHHVKCLAEYFDVTVISTDCDYGEICDRYAPDLALFEAGYRTHGSRRIRIGNTAANPGVPKLGLHNGDPWCDRRAGFLADMDAWGIETFFTIGTVMPEYTPAIADRTFVWPNFIDPEVFRDHGLEKVVPVMLTGQVYGLYPWRREVHRLLADHYPCLVSPTFGYDSSMARRLLTGDSYSRALNASWVAPSCGTMGHELVRKHLEIPGSACLLVTERTATLEAAGFRDGETCVFAEPDEVVPKLDALFTDRERMRAITAAGHELVHARHTLKHRPQIREWYELDRRRSRDQRIVQPGPFEPLQLVDASDPQRHGHVAGHGLDRVALDTGARRLHAGDIAGARAAYATALGFVSYLPEARLGLARCDLAAGAPEAALARLAGLIETTLADYGAATPDPVEWSIYLVALIATGRRADAAALCNRYPEIAHPEFVHLRRLLHGDAPRAAHEGPAAKGAGAIRRSSIHAVPKRSEESYRLWLNDLLARAGQPGVPAPASPRRRSRNPTRALIDWLDRGLLYLPGPDLPPKVPPGPGFHYCRHLVLGVGRTLLRGRARQIAKRLVAPARRHI